MRLVSNALKTDQSLQGLWRSPFLEFDTHSADQRDLPSDTGIARPGLPAVTGADFIASRLKLEAALSFRAHDLKDMATAANWSASSWSKTSAALRATLMALSGAKAFHGLDLDLRQTGTIGRNGYHIQKIYFQTRPGIYATANLYVPDGKGPFPAVINSHGHWPGGKAGEMVQACAISLAQNGYVCLNMDAWGACERTTTEGEEEYHGSNLGASLLDIGESLLGNQVSDNMRGVDLLCSLPFVDSSRIGATGASGGGNQTMWLGALDSRIKSCMPVVSVGTFQSYIMGSNCVCELMPSGLRFTEESGVLALMAPRYLKICSGLQDPSPTFAPEQMLRSFSGAARVYHLLHKKDHIQYQLFNTPHGYFPVMCQAMLGWFDLSLSKKGRGEPLAEKPIHLLPADQLSVFRNGGRSPLITTTVGYDKKCGRALNAALMQSAHAKTLKADQKRAALKELLGLDTADVIIRKGEQTVGSMGEMAAIGALAQGKSRRKGKMTGEADWQTGHIFTRNNHVIPYRLLRPKSTGARILIVCVPDSAVLTTADTPKASCQKSYQSAYLKKNFSALIEQYQNRGDGVIIADLWGLGAAGSAMGRKVNGTLPLFHTLARADIWLGKTVLGEWVSDLTVLSSFVQQEFGTCNIDVAAGKEVAVAALAANALQPLFDQLYLDHLPVDYTIDRREGMDYFNMAIHLPGVLSWGNVSLMAALNDAARLKIIHPVTITGKALTEQQTKGYRKAYQVVNAACGGLNNITITKSGSSREVP